METEQVQKEWARVQAGALVFAMDTACPVMLPEEPAWDSGAALAVDMDGDIELGRADMVHGPKAHITRMLLSPKRRMNGWQIERKPLKKS